MTNYPRKIYWLPFIGWSLKQIDISIKKYGLQEGWKRGLKDINIKLKLNLPKHTRTVLQNKPVILIGNHPHQLDGFALIATSPFRNSSFVIGMAEVLNLWPSIKRHSLKTYNIRNNWVDKIMMGIIGYLNNTRKMSKEQGRLYNRQIISKAAEKLKKGSLIMIMPGPHGKRNNAWKPGLGHLISNALNEKHKIYLVNSYIKGSTTFDFLCFLPLLGRLLPTLNVFFSKPILLTVFPAKLPAKSLPVISKTIGNGLTVKF